MRVTHECSTLVEAKRKQDPEDPYRTPDEVDDITSELENSEDTDTWYCRACGLYTRIEPGG